MYPLNTSELIGSLQSQIIGLQLQLLQQSTLNSIKTFDGTNKAEFAASEDDSSDDQSNQFFSEFEKLMSKDANDMSSWLHGLQADTAIVSEIFIEGFHALYNIQIGEQEVAALFGTGASINAISSKFFRSLQHQLKVIPTNRKVVLVDGDSLGPISEVHLQFQLGKVVFS